MQSLVQRGIPLPGSHIAVSGWWSDRLGGPCWCSGIVVSYDRKEIDSRGLKRRLEEHKFTIVIVCDGRSEIQNFSITTSRDATFPKTVYIEGGGALFVHGHGL